MLMPRGSPGFNRKWLYSAMTETPSGRVLLFTTTIWLLSLVYCKRRYWRDPHSAFFDSSTVYDQGYSSVREQEGMDFLGNSSSPTYTTSLNPVICAGIATVRRSNVQYVNTTVSSMLVGLSREERSAVHVRLLFADTNPQDHPDYGRQWLGRLDHVETYNVSSQTLAHLEALEDAQNFYEKGVFDYTYVLEQCLNHTTAPFIAIFEDDLVFADGWLAKTVQGLARLRNLSDSWLYLRLFYTETSLGWDKDQDFWYRYFWFTILLFASAAAACLTTVRRMCKPTRRVLTVPAIIVSSLVTVPACTVLYFMIGKYSIHPLSGVTRMDRYGCCTQALVFPRSRVPSLISYLTQRKAGQTDSMIEEYADALRLERYALSPQVVQHIGLVSSRDNLEINTKSTWAFWFEANDAARLRAEHEELAKGTIWRASGRDTSI
ncbi:hypothetical protein M436DRAFT_68450 [Aureobasidium namibiae CBS 147.97]|uniref:Integral membrane protein n=1 Tax=Aureobasidium namibiae CBS 147.97 TaxID=1043004 RepID=A0A074W919_9PEZI|nr:uncharacterized protein M436DRAFT_68450 [Aureobasidium namibiae CBS 147.97]KEQ68079.1 hypothetical protein M436DRAFT_68450 [Aureobasidium namibiae CBS 147.97]